RARAVAPDLRRTDHRMEEEREARRAIDLEAEMCLGALRRRQVDGEATRREEPARVLHALVHDRAVEAHAQRDLSLPARAEARLEGERARRGDGAGDLLGHAGPDRDPGA